MNENQIATLILDAAFKVHRELGPGLLESSYQKCLEFELRRLNLKVACEKGLRIIYQEVKLELGYRIDLLVEDKVIIEVKSVESLNDIHLAQILTYLKLNNSKLGLLINFNVSKLKDGIKRVINGQIT